MRRAMNIGVLAAAVLLLSASLATAETKLLRPKSTNYYRYSAMRAAGLRYRAPGAKVTQIGVTSRGDSILMVKSPELKVPAIVRGRQGQYGADVKRLSGPEIRKLGLVTPAGALSQAQSHSRSALFKKVRGKIEFAGASNKGQSYRFTVTPKKPVKVRDRWGGQYTIKKLERYVNVNGTGETAQPSGGSTWNWLPPDQR